MLTAPSLTEFDEKKEGCKFVEPFRDVRFLWELQEYNRGRDVGNAIPKKSMRSPFSNHWAVLGGES